METDNLDRTAVEAALAERGMAPIDRLVVLDQVGSTSTELRAHAAGTDAWPDGSVLVADHQVGGRGRAGRTWTTPRGQALTFSVLLRPGVPAERLGWAPLIGGLAVVRALSGLGLAPVVKWPNDVLLPAATSVAGWGAFRKVAGVLGDLVVDAGPAVVLGIGINVHQGLDDLAVPTATSMALAGRPVPRAEVLAAVLDELGALVAQWGEGRTTGGLVTACAEACVTIGRSVQVARPGGETIVGVATGLADDGALMIESGGHLVTVHAGDVTLRTGDDAPAD